MMRAAVNFLIAASFMLSSLPRAQANTIAAAPAGSTESIKKAMLLKPAEFAVGIGHGLLFVMTIAGIDLLVQEIKSQGLSVGSVSPSKLQEIASKVGTEVVNNGQIFTSLVGAGAFASVAQKPAEALAKLLTNAPSRKVLASLITTSIISTGGFLGWEFGAQLWTEASMMIEDQNDYQRLSSFFGVGSGAFRSLFSKLPSNQDVQDLRIAKTMFSNMMTILFLDKTLLNNWFNNTWRLRVMTGEAMTFMTLTFAGTAIGSAVLPFGGSFIGFMFGFAAATVVPHSVNNAMTFSFKTIRSYLSLDQLRSNQTVLLKEALRNYGGRTFSSTLIQRKTIRESVVTGAAEQLHLGFKILQSEQYGKSARTKAHERIAEALKRISDLYSEEETVLSNLISSATNPAHLAQLKADLASVKSLNEFWPPTIQEIQARVGTEEQPLTKSDVEEPTLNSLLKFIETFHLRGYVESSVL